MTKLTKTKIKSDREGSMQAAPFKICRNCNCHNGTKKRKCASCGGDRFDMPTNEQMITEATRMTHINALLAQLAEGI